MCQDSPETQSLHLDHDGYRISGVPVKSQCSKREDKPWFHDLHAQTCCGYSPYARKMHHCPYLLKLSRMWPIPEDKSTRPGRLLANQAKRFQHFPNRLETRWYKCPGKYVAKQGHVGRKDKNYRRYGKVWRILGPKIFQVTVLLQEAGALPQLQACFTAACSPIARGATNRKTIRFNNVVINPISYLPPHTTQVVNKPISVITV